MPRAFSRHSGAALLLAAVLAGTAGCGSSSTTSGNSGSIKLTLSPTSATIAQGGSTQVTGSISRTNFTGSVVITVDNVPTGVTGSATLTGDVATVTIATTSAALPGSYTLTVHAKGNGIDDAPATFTLTVAAATPASFTFSLGAPALSVAQGQGGTSSIRLVRTNFTGGVALSAENLPLGATASFNVTPVTTDSSNVGIAVGASVVPGIYNLLIRGTASGLTDVTAPLTLTVLATGNFTIAAGSTAVGVTQAGSNTTSITATRTGGFTGTISYSAASTTTGLTASVAATATADVNTLTVAATGAVTPGTYPVVVSAASPGVTTQQLTINVTVAVPGGFTITTGATAVSVAQGTAALSWIKAVRTGGFAGVIVYAVTGAPTGLTVVVAPTSVADSSTITLTATGNLPVGPYVLVLNATSGALAAPPINLSVTVTANGLSGIVQLGAGDTHMCGLDAAGVGHCWGNNNQGQLGDPTFVGPSSATPRVVLANGQSWAEIRGGLESSCARTTAGAAYCWGEGSDGGVGNGSGASTRTPSAVTSSGQNYAQVSPGAFFACGRTTANVVWCWGGNFDGQLGDGTSTQRNSPVLAQTGALSFVDIVSSPDGYFTCGRVTSGAAHCWGYNGNGELADNTTVNRTSPVAVMGGNTFAGLVAGTDNACGNLINGNWVCWGANAYGELGDGSQTERHTPVPLLANGNTFVQLTMGTYHTCGRTAAGAVFCWGRNSSGQLGNGGSLGSNSPVAVSGGHLFTDIRAGDNFTCGLSDNGTVFCWGDNSRNQLGSSAVGSSNVPLKVGSS